MGAVSTSAATSERLAALSQMHAVARVYAQMLTPDGDTAFHDLTGEVARRGADLPAPGVPAIHNAQHFAIVVDCRVTALPYINYEELPDGIRGGGAQINGGFTLLSARALAAVLASGPLPVAQGAQ